jgi:hypothetical protein
MNLLKALALISLLFFVTACSEAEVAEEPVISEPETEAETERELPNAVRVLSENAEQVPLPSTELLSVESILETLDLNGDFPGTYIVSRRFTEQMINTLLSLGHTITDEYVTETFIYLTLECDNYSYLMWWSNNSLLLAGDFVTVRESFLR